ncbi:MAG: peroxiredoxin family protein [Halobacteriales archaeon]|nr:peroxiredoxin family protein [Halobacteriales archaeon]
MAICLLLLALGGLPGCIQRSPAPVTQLTFGAHFPSFSAIDLDGEPFSSNKFNGNVSILMIADYDDNSIITMFQFSKIHLEFPNLPAVILVHPTPFSSPYIKGHIKDDLVDWRNRIQNVTSPIIVDEDNRLFTSFHLTNENDVLVFDKNGILRVGASHFLQSRDRVCYSEAINSLLDVGRPNRYAVGNRSC